MTTWRKRSIKVIVADSGPLISLACADELHLLQTFGQPVVISDVARRECTSKVGAPGEQRLALWFETGGGNQFSELSTPMLAAYDEAMKRVRDGSDPYAAIGLGDATISWMLKNLTRLRTTDGQLVGLESDDLALILTEDGAFGDGPVLMQRRAHVLSTRQFLKTLERIEAIPSYQAIIDEIQLGGRVPSSYMADRPALVDATTRSDWKDGTEKTVSLLKSDSAAYSDDNEDGSGGGASGGPGSRRR